MGRYRLGARPDFPQEAAPLAMSDALIMNENRQDLQDSSVFNRDAP